MGKFLEYNSIINIFSLLYGCFNILCGFKYLKFPPIYPPDKYGKNTIRSVSGYRTPSSKKNRESWFKAQKYFSNYLIVSGSLFLIFTIILLFLCYKIKIISLFLLDDFLFYLFLMQITGSFFYCEYKLKILKN